MKYFSMFSGIGGFEKGIEDAFSNKQFTEIEQDGEGRNGNTDEDGRDVLSASRTAPLCIGFSEIDKNAINIYLKHYPGHKNYGDATRIIPTEIPDFDILVGGFPCQAFSIAGKRLGFDDTRGTLFFDIARILREKRPGQFLLENVKGLLSHDNGKTFRTIISTLAEMGYCVEWEVLNSKNFGVPQNRERVFIHGFREGCGRQIFPLGSSSQEINKSDDRIPQQIASTVFASQHKIERGMDMIQTCIPVLTPDRPEKRQNGRRFKEDGEESFTCTAQDKHGVFDGYKIRRLTPVECERLQGFPDDWTKYGADGKVMSDSARYKACGNAVTTNVIRAIMEEIINQPSFDDGV